MTKAIPIRRWLAIVSGAMLARLLLKNISVVGVGWGAYEMDNPELGQQQWHELLPLIESGALTPPIHRVYPMEEIQEALTAMELRQVTGKIVLAFK